MRELSAKDKAFLKERQKLLKQISEKREEITRLHAELDELKKEREQLRADLENFEKYKDIDNKELREHMENTKRIQSFLRLCDYITM